MVCHAESVIRTMMKNRVICDITKEYCRHFHIRTTGATPPKAPWPTDIEVPFTDWASLVVAMRHEVQVVIGIRALEVLKTSSGFLNRTLLGQTRHKLKEQIQDGLSTVLVTNTGEVQRVTCVVAFRITRFDGKVFVQVGKHNGEQEIKPSMELPGSLHKKGESPDDVRRRILATKLGPMSEIVKLRGSDTDSISKVSNEFQMKTTYLRTVWHGTVDTSKVSEDLPCRVQQSPSTISEDKLPPGCDVYCFHDGDGYNFFAWLSDDDFDDLKKPENHDLVASWLSTLQLVDDGQFDV